MITVDGVPAAQLGPLTESQHATLEELIAAGLVRPPRVTTPPAPANPVPAPPGPTTTEILREHRDR